jgi:hypothetical protein
MTFDELQLLTEKNTKAIAELIVVSRTVLDHAKIVSADLEKSTKEMNDRMNALIHIVDDLVRDRWRRKNENGEKNQ